MGIGASIFLIAVGAILTFAVQTTVSGISISTVGVILMVVGGIGLLWSLMVASAWYRGRGGDVVATRRTYVRDDVL